MAKEKEKYQYYPSDEVIIIDKNDLHITRVVWFIIGFLFALIFIAAFFFEQINQPLDFLAWIQ